MSEIKSFRDLDAWNVAMDLAVDAYGVAARLPASERYGLAAQIGRAAASIPSNIAEGHGCGGRRYVYHVRIALGSLAELDTELELAKRLKYVPAEAVQMMAGQIARTGQLLNGLLRSLDRKKPVAIVVACFVAGALWVLASL